MTLQKRILVPLASTEKGLKGIHHAMALAERLKAKVYILQLSRNADDNGSGVLAIEETLADVINSARLAGLSISHHLAAGDLEGELVDLVRKEDIDVLVFSADDEQCTGVLQHVRPRISSQIIEVEEKDHIDTL